MPRGRLIVGLRDLGKLLFHLCEPALESCPTRTTSTSEKRKKREHNDPERWQWHGKEETHYWCLPAVDSPPCAGTLSWFPRLGHGPGSANLRCEVGGRLLGFLLPPLFLLDHAHQIAQLTLDVGVILPGRIMLRA
jgi:hypothetical protein